MNERKAFSLDRTHLICIAALIGAAIAAAFLYPGLGGLSIWSLTISLGVGAVAWGVLHFIKSDYRITFVEATIAAVVLIVAVVPLTDWVGTKIAFNNQVTYHEFLNGYEANVTTVVHHCYESSSDGGSTGGCVHTFDADSYIVVVHHHVCSGSGSKQTCTDYDTYETHYRQVPYTDTETDWIVQTTLGDFTVGPNWLPSDPNAHRIRAHDGSEDAIPASLPTGTPKQWLDAKQRIDSGNPGPVTVPHDYANYILASQTTILKQYSPEIAQYKAAGVLPAIGHSISDPYYLNRMYYVGISLPNQGAWSYDLQHFDAALGTGLQGNMYVVVVNSNKVTNPDLYIDTLTAYWESPAFGKDAISKNGIIVVLGTKDGQTIDWARASTGMPVGNQVMIHAVANNLPGKALDPAALFGDPVGVVSQVNGKWKAQIKNGSPEGELEAIMWGPNGFQRVCMTCQSKGDTGVGFSYLKSQIQPTTGQTIGILSVLFLLSLIVWGLCIFLAVPVARNLTGSDPYATRKHSGGSPFGSGWS